MKIAKRGNTLFRINPLYARFDETLMILEREVEFKSKKSRFLNPLYTSQACMGGEDIIYLEHNFKKILIYGDGINCPLMIIPPMFFPFFSVGVFRMQLDEGSIEFSIARDSEKKSFGNIKFLGINYRYSFKQFYYKSENYFDMFPDFLPSEFSPKSIQIVVFACLWLNAYNAQSIV